MALVVGRGRRAVRVVGGHGFLSDTRGRPLSCLRPLSTARPLGVAWDRASRAVGCAGPSTALDQLSAAADNQVPRTRRMLVSLFSELEQSTRTIHYRGSAPDAAHTRGNAGLGKLKFFSGAPGQGNFNFEPD